MKCSKEQLVWELLRLGMGLIFLWAFIDKLFGMGFTTCRDAQINVINFMCEGAWINGGSPTFGFLKFATHGPLASIYQGMAGIAVVDWLFMLGLFFVGTALTLGILVRLGGYIGILMLLLMYTAGFMPPEHHPFLDEHIVYVVVMTGLIVTGSGKHLGFGRKWSNTDLVQRHKILE